MSIGRDSRSQDPDSLSRKDSLLAREQAAPAENVAIENVAVLSLGLFPLAKVFCETMTAPIPTIKDKKRILIVEDDPEMRDLHRKLLSDDYTVIDKPDGSNTIRYLQENRNIHLAIIDFKLPDMTGIEVLKQLKKVIPCTPAIFITGHGSEDVAVNAFRCGARDYVKKPFAYNDFIKRIDFCLSLNEIKQVKRRRPATLEAGQLHGRPNAIKKSSLEQARRYIDNNYATEISLDEAADRAGMSRFHFSRVFKKRYGITFQSYLNRLRIEQAKKLLKETTFTVTDVAFSAGYSDLTHFERIFKKVVHCTPSQFKSQNTKPADRRR